MSRVVSTNRRTGFTLVELLVSLTVIAVIAGMVAIAVSGANRQARETRAQSLTNALNLISLQIYEESTRRRVELPAGFSTKEARGLSALMWKRDWLRCAFPDRREDIISLPIAIPYPNTSNNDFIDTDLVPGTNDRGRLFVPPPGSGTNALGIRSQELLRYRTYITQTINTAKGNGTANSWAMLVDGVTDLQSSPPNLEWTPTHQSAECLYLILATHNINGAPANDFLRTRDIGDTDDDGMPEILDPWGQPVGFMRWPVGLSLTPNWNVLVETPESTNNRAQWAALAAMKDEMGRDNIDILYLDPRYADNGTMNATDYPQAEDPFPLNPIVVSAGADGVFDLYGLDPDTIGNPPSIVYALGGLPNTSSSFVNPPLFPANMRFIDPYMDGVRLNEKLGARVDFNGDGVDDSADNVYPTYAN